MEEKENNKKTWETPEIVDLDIETTEKNTAVSEGYTPFGGFGPAS